jgi:hypothetical protein
MYGILLIGPQAPPELITAARSRADFLAALKMRDTPHNWHRAVSDFTVAREVSDFYDARHALDEVRRNCPQHYLDCRFLLRRFLYRLTRGRRRNFRRTMPLLVYDP